MKDPRQILGVSAQAGPEEIRAAYLRKVQEFPPERCPEEFEAIRDAFDALSDPRKRMRALLEWGDPEPAAVSILEGEVATRPYAGPQAWMDVLAAGSRKER